MPRFKTAWTAVLLGAATFILYALRLDLVPPFLKYEEVFFALQSRALAASLHDTHGRFMPLYFQVYENAWYQPVLAYWGAVFQWILPLSDTTIRVPTATVGAINVVLTYYIGLRLFGQGAWAVLAALALALTPPHFILSRVAMDYVYPLPFVLGWFLALLIYLESRSLRALAVGSCLLGVGFFSYIAAVGLMPVFLVATLAVIAVREPTRIAAYLAAAAGFVCILGVGVWLTFQLPGYLATQTGSYLPGLTRQPRGDVLQRLREYFNYTNISAQAGLYSEFFNAGYLFFSGGTNPVDSTRTVGVYLLPAAIFIPAGIYAALRERSLATALIVFGFFYAPVPAAMIPERYTIDRHMVMVPFAALLTAYGIRLLWSLPVPRVTRYVAPFAIGGIVIAIGYAIYTLADRGVISRSTVPLAIASIGLIGLARQSDKVQRGSVITAALLAFGLLQFTYFTFDYFTDYRLRVTRVFGSNLRGAVQAAMKTTEAAAVPVRVSRAIPFADYYVRFYSAVAGRPEFADGVTYFSPDTTAGPEDQALYLTGLGGGDAGFITRSGLRVIETISDPTGEPAFLLLRRQ